jgi:hypothetical protein
VNCGGEAGRLLHRYMDKADGCAGFYLYRLVQKSVILYVTNIERFKYIRKKLNRRLWTSYNIDLLPSYREPAMCKSVQFFQLCEHSAECER